MNYGHLVWNNSPPNMNGEGGVGGGAVALAAFFLLTSRFMISVNSLQMSLLSLFFVFSVVLLNNILCFICK